MKEILMLFAALLLAVVCTGFAIRLDGEYRAVHQIRVSGDSLLTEWKLLQCIPQPSPRQSISRAPCAGTQDLGSC